MSGPSLYAIVGAVCGVFTLTAVGFATYIIRRKSRSGVISLEPRTPVGVQLVLSQQGGAAQEMVPHGIPLYSGGQQGAYPRLELSGSHQCEKCKDTSH